MCNFVVVVLSSQRASFEYTQFTAALKLEVQSDARGANKRIASGVNAALVVCLNVLIMLFLFVEVHHSLIYCKNESELFICYADKLKQFQN